MTEKDKKDFKLIVGEALEDVVLPQMQEIRDDIQIIKEDIVVIKEDVSVLKEDVSTLKEDVQDLKNTTNRIEMRQNAEIIRSDQHGQRIERLEKACLKS